MYVCIYVCMYVCMCLVTGILRRTDCVRALDVPPASSSSTAPEYPSARVPMVEHPRRNTDCVRTLPHQYPLQAQRGQRQDVQDGPRRDVDCVHVALGRMHARRRATHRGRWTPRIAFSGVGRSTRAATRVTTRTEWSAAIFRSERTPFVSV